jgi:hypothetical protein
MHELHKVSWWERFWQVVALAICVTAFVFEGLLPGIKWVIGRL